jgi:hypothetical protein
MTKRRGLIALAVFLVLSATADAQTAPTREAIRYTLRFPAPQTNSLEVEAIVAHRRAPLDRNVHGCVDAGPSPTSTRKCGFPLTTKRWIVGLPATMGESTSVSKSGAR